MSIQRAIVISLSLSLAACAARPAPEPVAPVSATRTEAQAADPIAAPAPAAPRVLPQVIADAPAADAPAELSQYGQLVGTWKCKGSNRLTGAWKDTPGESTWTWFYTLGGHAIQDVFEPSPEVSGAVVGTNLRVYDAQAGKWHMVWTTANQPFFDEFEAEYADGKIVMTGQRRARKAFPAHTARITFHDIRADQYSWRYEAPDPNNPAAMVEYSRFVCRRVGGLTAAAE